MELEQEEMIKLYSIHQEVTKQRLESLNTLEKITVEERKMKESIENKDETLKLEERKQRNIISDVLSKINDHKSVGQSADNTLFEGIQNLQSSYLQVICFIHNLLYVLYSSYYDVLGTSCEY
jgi:hypothetical protein